MAVVADADAFFTRSIPESSDHFGPQVPLQAVNKTFKQPLDHFSE